MELFPFLFLLFSFCHPVIYRVVSIVSDGRNQTSLVFFYVVFEFLYWCVNAAFDVTLSLLIYFWWVLENMSFQET